MMMSACWKLRSWRDIKSLVAFSTIDSALLDMSPIGAATAPDIVSLMRPAARSNCLYRGAPAICGTVFCPTPKPDSVTVTAFTGRSTRKMAIVLTRKKC